MIVVLKPDTSAEAIESLLAHIQAGGVRALPLQELQRNVLAIVGEEQAIAELNLEFEPAVESVKRILTPYKLASRELHPADTIVSIGSAAIGGGKFAVIAGPCAVETYEQTLASARAAKEAGADAIRGGAFKGRTSPYDFPGQGPDGLRILRRVGDELGLPVVTEVMDAADLSLIMDHADALQIGTRNMQNFSLLRAIGSSRKPVLLKRGMSARVDELLLAAEYLLAGGNEQVVLVERGIRTFETATRNTLDLNAVPYLKMRSHLPVMVDPSHGTGIRELVTPMALAAAACGSDGLLVEVHENPAKALSDGTQSLYPEDFKRLMAKLRPLLAAVERCAER